MSGLWVGTIYMCLWINENNICYMYFVKQKLTAVGFEPTPPERLVPKTSALDLSAKLPLE